MTTKTQAMVTIALIAALPLAAAMPDGGSTLRVERIALASADGEAPEGGAKRMVKVVVVGGEGDEARVIEDVLVDAPHARVLRLEGAPGEAGERVRVFHTGREGTFGAIAGRGFLGVHLIDLTPELRAHFGAGEEAGLLVGRVEAGSPAEQAGLRVGDLLTRVGGEPVTGTWDVTRQVRPLTAGQGIALEVMRDGRVETLSATVGEREAPQIEAHALLRRLGEDGEAKVWQLDPEALRERMGDVTELFASPEWQDRVKTLTVTGEGLGARLEELEREIERLSEELARRHDEGGERE